MSEDGLAGLSQLICAFTTGIDSGKEHLQMAKRTYDDNTVIIFDTTLRDGEQSPGATLSSAEKLEIARQLSRLGVDVIEAGFPAASPDDLKAVQRIAREVGTPDGPTVAGLSRALESDIRTAWEGVKEAAKPRIHTFLGTSPSHLAMLRIDKEEGLERIRSASRWRGAFAMMSNSARWMPAEPIPSI